MCVNIEFRSDTDSSLQVSVEDHARLSHTHTHENQKQLSLLYLILSNHRRKRRRREVRGGGYRCGGPDYQSAFLFPTSHLLYILGMKNLPTEVNMIFRKHRFIVLHNSQLD